MFDAMTSDGLYEFDIDGNETRDHVEIKRGRMATAALKILSLSGIAGLSAAFSSFSQGVTFWASQPMPFF